MDRMVGLASSNANEFASHHQREKAMPIQKTVDEVLAGRNAIYNDDKGPGRSLLLTAAL